MHPRLNSPRQLLNRLAHRLTKVVRFLSIHPPVENLTYIGVGQPEFDVVRFVGHRVLILREPGACRRRRTRRRTTIIVRRILTEPKTALAGVALETSFARFMASIAAFNKERVLSRRFCRLGPFGSMVESRGSSEKAVCCAGCAEGPEP